MGAQSSSARLPWERGAFLIIAVSAVLWIGLWAVFRALF
jgi:hypothetical protein